MTDVPLMVTDGFKTQQQAIQAGPPGRRTSWGLPGRWLWTGHAREVAATEWGDPRFPRFPSPPPGGVTAWFTMRLTALANHETATFDPPLSQAIDAYESRDAARAETWRQAFGANLLAGDV